MEGGGRARVKKCGQKEVWGGVGGGQSGSAKKKKTTEYAASRDYQKWENKSRRSDTAKEEGNG